MASRVFGLVNLATLYWQHAICAITRIMNSETLPPFFLLSYKKYQEIFPSDPFDSVPCCNRLDLFYVEHIRISLRLFYLVVDLSMRLAFPAYN